MFSVISGLGARASGGTATLFRMAAVSAPDVLPFDAELLGEIENIGFHPFILVRLENEPQRPGRFIVCRTQNDAGTFVNDLSRLPDFAASKLLRGIERALQTEIYDAAELLFSWTKSQADGLHETVYIGDASTIDLPTFYGYPAFGLSRHAARTSQAARVRALIKTFDAYEATTGNDALRFAVMQSLAFALSRALGLSGQFEQALGIVDRAIAQTPYSIHLKAARHTLALKIDKKRVPPRLEKYVGEDSGHLKEFVCAKPFERFDVGPDGGVMLCCGHWLPTSIGNFLDDPADEILNSPAALRIRASVTDGSFKYCNHLDCSFMVRDILPKRNEVAHERTRKAIAEKDFRVDGMESLLFALDQTCNLSCPSCRTHVITEKVSQSIRKASAIEEKLVPLLPTLRLLNLNPAGELLVSKPSRTLLGLINDDRCPELRLEIISNGTLFNRDEWNKFPGIHNKIRSIRISTDAATRETFEKLRRLGKYDIFRRNMEFLRDLRSGGVIPELNFSFTYQLDNFQEMPNFVAFCQEMCADFVIFERLQNIAFSDAEFRDKAVHRRDHPLHGAFLEVIRNPVFRGKEVSHDFDYEEQLARQIPNVKKQHWRNLWFRTRPATQIAGG